MDQRTAAMKEKPMVVSLVNARAKNLAVQMENAKAAM